MDWSTKNVCAMSGNKLLVDTNILIYYFDGNLKARQLVDGNHIFVSAITVIEVLGYLRISPSEEQTIRSLLQNCQLVELTPSIRERAIRLKQTIRIKTPDAIIAASALELGLSLATGDSDFDRVPELSVVRL